MAQPMRFPCAHVDAMTLWARNSAEPRNKECRLMGSQLVFPRYVWLIGFVLFVCSAAPAQVPKDTTPPQTGSISGHVLVNNKAAVGVEVAAFSTESANRRIPAAQSKTD